jgi:hypothetical protein
MTKHPICCRPRPARIILISYLSLIVIAKCQEKRLNFSFVEYPRKERKTERISKRPIIVTINRVEQFIIKIQLEMFNIFLFS